MQIFVHHNGIQLGPYPIEVVHAQLANGSLALSDLAWYEGLGQWQPLASIPGIGVGVPLPGGPPLLYPANSSALATCSLILGIVGLFTFGLTGIPAVICGHLARGKIKRSVGTLGGSGFALAGLVVGYISITFFALLIPAGYAAGYAAVKKAKSVKTLANAVSIESAVDSFLTTYGALPSTTPVYDTTTDVSLIKALVGDDKTVNIRGIKFLAMRMVHRGADGLDPISYKAYDVWGNGYVVILDTDLDGTIVVTRGGMTETVTSHHALVYSKGADGIAGTTDDVKSW